MKPDNPKIDLTLDKEFFNCQIGDIKFSWPNAVKVAIRICSGFEQRLLSGQNLPPAVAPSSIKIDNLGKIVLDQDFSHAFLYSAPEIRNGAKFTQASLVYSIGALLFEMITGFPPFGDFWSINYYVTGLPFSLLNVIFTALDNDPQGRYPSLAAFKRALIEVLVPSSRWEHTIHKLYLPVGLKEKLFLVGEKIRRVWLKLYNFLPLDFFSNILRVIQAWMSARKPIISRAVTLLGLILIVWFAFFLMMPPGKGAAESAYESDQKPVLESIDSYWQRQRLIVGTLIFVPDTPTMTSSPTNTPTATQTQTPSITPTFTPSVTPTPSKTGSPTWTPTKTNTPSITPTSTSSSTPTNTRTPTPSRTPTWTVSPLPSRTPLPPPTQCPPLDLEIFLEGQWCANTQKYTCRVSLTPRGGCGPYTYFHDINQIGYSNKGIVYEFKWTEEHPAIGTFSIVGKDGQRVNKEFFYRGIECSN